MKTRNSLTVVFLMCALLFGGCSGDAGAQTDVSSGTSAAEESKTETESKLPDNVPELDFKGYEFKMFMRNNERFIPDMYAENLSGELMNDAVYRRNSEVAERFNLSAISLIRDSDSASTATGKNALAAVLAGEDAYDVIIPHAQISFMFGEQGVALDWMKDLKYVDLEQPWWCADARDNLSLGGKLYTMTGDISWNNLGSTCAMLFNKKLVEELNLGDIYKTVSDGKWTFDSFEGLAKKATADLNGDGARKLEDDRYGYITGQWCGPVNVLFSGGQRTAKKNSSDLLELTLYNEKTVKIYERFFALTDSDAGYVNTLTHDYVPLNPVFANDRALFMDVNFSAIEQLRDMETDFGIIPWPKFDESVDGYYTKVDAGCNMFVVPVTAGDPSRTSAVLEALCRLGYYDVVPVFYDVVLTVKNTRDTESAAMIDLIRAGRVFDIGYFYNDKTMPPQIGTIGTYIARAEDHNFTSFYAQYEEKAKAVIKQLNELYSK